MHLEEITGSTTLENLEVECKARLDRNNPQSWIKTVGGFSNAAGGTFYRDSVCNWLPIPISRALTWTVAKQKNAGKAIPSVFL